MFFAEFELKLSNSDMFKFPDFVVRLGYSIRYNVCLANIHFLFRGRLFSFLCCHAKQDGKSIIEHEFHLDFYDTRNASYITVTFRSVGFNKWSIGFKIFVLVDNSGASFGV